MAEKQVEPFSSREQDIMAKAWLCMDAEPKINYTQLAELCGFTNVRSASNAWGAIKKKLLTAAGNGGDTPKDKSAGNEDANTPKSQATSTKKRGRAAKGDSNDTPSKKPRGRAKKQPTPEPSPERAADDEDEKEAGDAEAVADTAATVEKDYDSEEELNKALLGENSKLFP